MRIKNKYEIQDDSTVAIKQNGIDTDSFISITPGSSQKTLTNSGNIAKKKSFISINQKISNTLNLLNHRL